MSHDVEAQSSTRTVTIKNTGSTSIYNVRIAPSTSRAWGSDWLSLGESIAPGEHQTFHLSYLGTYDLRVEDILGRKIAQANDIFMSRNKPWIIDEVALVVENDSSQTICDMYIAPWDDTTYGSDWLGVSERIRPNTESTFYVNPGRYDLLTRDCNHDILDSIDKVSLYSRKIWTVETTIDLTIVNQSGWRI